MHPGNTRQLSFEMRDRTQVWIISVKIAKCPAQEREQFRLMMIALGTNLDQLNKVSGGLSSEIIFSDAYERIFDDNFSQCVQRRFAARHNRDFRFEKKIELAGEWSLCAARALSDCLDAA